jgi:hypothetical protein
MKKILFLFLVALSLLPIKAQNIQVLINEKNNLATFEIYKAFDHSSLYYFSDFKFSKNGYDEVYSEISYYQNIKEILLLTAQYNAGLNKDFHIKPIYLTGLSKTFTIWENFNFSFDVLYRYQVELITEPEIDWGNNGFQITTSFSQSYDKVEVSGYCDFWNFQYFIFEPQGWWKFSKRIYAGLEWRVSNYDLLEDYENYVMLGLKFNLE